VPVIPGRTEKMGHFFSSDPESEDVMMIKKWELLYLQDIKIF